MYSSISGETLLVLRDGADAFVLALAARLHHRGDTDAARAWVSWARALEDSTPLQIADVALALAAEDVAEALADTSHAPHDGVGGVVLQALRARALEQSGKTEAALTVYEEARRRAERLGEDGVASNLALRSKRRRGRETPLRRPLCELAPLAERRPDPGRPGRSRRRGGLWPRAR